MDQNFYPHDVSVSIRLESLIKITDKRSLSEKMSYRMIKCASIVDNYSFIGWQMAIPRKGTATVTLYGTADFSSQDLKWIAEKTGKAAKSAVVPFKGVRSNVLNELYEVYLPIADNCFDSAIGFGANSSEKRSCGATRWPAYYTAQFEELISALRETGAILRATVGAASEEQKESCFRHMTRTYDVSNIPFKEYVGRPVKMRVLLRLPTMPSIRLKTVIEDSVQGAKLRLIGKMEGSDAEATWNSPLTDAPVLPDYAARIMMLEPEVTDATVGIQTCDEPMKKLPCSHKNTKSAHAVEIGKAIDTIGARRRIAIGEMDLKRHYQIVGQTGTGKSTLLANLILSAIAQGHGLSFFDPHGSTIDVILRSLPEKYMERVRVVRIGDTENPVPMNIWNSDDPEKEERTISDLCELFGEIFNPPGECFVGPRWERWFSTFAKASIAFLGHRASLESIAVISQSKDNMFQVYRAIESTYPELAEIIKQEYGTDKSSDFQSTLNWYLCKFQRLISVEQLRKTLGGGANALDYKHTIDTDAVTLIDLGSPIIGTSAARIVGTLLLMNLWNAAMERQEREKTHLVVVDEASLFQTNPMPRMLAESRKFGLSMILSHQHAGQMSKEIRDSLEANSANFSAFRLSAKDAAVAAIRFDDPEMQVALTRLDAFNAITTLSVDGRQTTPFTMEITRPKKQPNGQVIATQIEQQSIKRLVEPFHADRALTAAEIKALLNDPAKAELLKKKEPIPTWLESWTERQKQKKAI